MPTLLIRHGYGTRFINERSIERVPLAKSNGEHHFAKFGSFVEYSESIVLLPMAGIREVKIDNVWGYSAADGYINVYYFGLNAMALGYYMVANDTVSIPLLKGFPLVWCDLKVANNANNPTKKNNVVDLFSGNS